MGSAGDGSGGKERSRVGSVRSGQVEVSRRGVWPGVLRRLKPALAEAGSVWSSRVLPGRADGSSAYTWLGARTGGWCGGSRR